jgi:hypothetical protein
MVHTKTKPRGINSREKLKKQTWFNRQKNTPSTPCWRIKRGEPCLP